MSKTALDLKMKEIMDRHHCGCETCAHTAALCPATASSLIEELAVTTLERDELQYRLTESHKHVRLLIEERNTASQR